MLIVITPDVSWVRSLFKAMPGDVEICFLNVHNLRERWRWASYPWKTIGRWKPVQANVRQVNLLLPTYFGRISRWVVRRYIRSAIRREEQKRADLAAPPSGTAAKHAVIFVYPWHAMFLGITEDSTTAYLAHDPFTFYQCWNPAEVAEQERQLLAGCDAVFAITRELADDFEQAKERNAKVYVSQNGVDASCIADAVPPRPLDLPADLAIVGCVGQINDTFDWEWIESVAERNPSYRFVFIGAVVEEHPTLRALIEKRLKAMNVLWLGPRPHESLAAYIASFDVCLCPLRKNAHNDRRCPLRFFDYMAGGRPILTTAISEAFAHQGYLHIVECIDEASAVLEGLRTGSIKHDSAAMRSYARRNTWTDRAAALLDTLQVVATESASVTKFAGEAARPPSE